jgi:hypothetical protein
MDCRQFMAHRKDDFDIIPQSQSGANVHRSVILFAIPTLAFLFASAIHADSSDHLRIAWSADWLTVRGGVLGDADLRVHYLEAYCRPHSTNRRWDQTVIPHHARLTETDAGGTKLVVEDTLADGVVVRHEITAGKDEIDFHLIAHNPTTHPSEAHWAQPCVRVGPFAGLSDKSGDAYLPKCFIFLDGKLTRMPAPKWATHAMYTPGQVWCPKGVSRDDVNPRPLSDDVPDNGLIGCFRADDQAILATAWEPYQELFQGVAACIHSDFRIGGLSAGQTKHIRGKIYIVGSDVPALLARYRRDFPEQQTRP